MCCRVRNKDLYTKDMEVEELGQVVAQEAGVLPNPETKIIFMYRRPILCTMYGAVDFLNVLKKYIMYL
jgi:hypothetical protein